MALLEQLTGVLPGHELGRDGHKGYRLQAPWETYG